MFVPEPAQKKAEKEMNNLRDKMRNGKIKMQIKAAGGNMPVVEWSLKVLLNNLKMPAGMIIITKK
jgi:hypothetical protein